MKKTILASAIFFLVTVFLMCNIACFGLALADDSTDDASLQAARQQLFELNLEQEKNKGYGLIDVNGQVVLPCAFQSISWLSKDNNHLLIVVLNDKYGCIDINGEIVIPLKYNYIEELDDESGLSLVEDEYYYRGFIDTTGKEILPCIYDNASSFSEGLAAVEEDDKWGFIDTNGECIIPFQYDDADSFINGLARVGSNGKYGYVNTEGEYVILPLYDDIYSGPLHDGYKIGVLNEKQGIINPEGKIVLDMQYDQVYMIKNNLACVIVNDNYGLIDLSTKDYIIPCECNNIYFRDGYWNIKRGEVKEIRDIQGNIIISAEVPYLGWVYDEMIAYSDGVKQGYYNTSGEIAIPAEYDSCGNFEDGYAEAKKDGKWGLIDKHNNIVIPFEYEDIQFLRKNRVFVKGNKDKPESWFLLDLVGNIIAPCPHNISSTSSFEKGMLIVYD